jgi:phytoene desaturase (3,4-didehydrolycopene-forming)
MQEKNVVVIGAGVGGLATAARLAQTGCQVTVVEKCGRVGGRCGMIEQDGHRFNTGPTLYLIPELYEAAFTALKIIWTYGESIPATTSTSKTD